MAINGHYDVIVIGSGAGGGTLTYALAPTGKKILLLERGDYVPREKANWEPKGVNVEGKYQTKESWYDKDGKPTTSAATPSSTARLSFGFARRTSAKSVTMAAFLQHGRFPTTTSSRTT